MGGPRRSHASGAEGKAAGRRKRLWGPGATCLPARKPVGQPQRACSAPAAAPSGETPPRPPAARRPAPPRRPATPLVAAATLPPGEPPAAKLVFPDDVILHPQPKGGEDPWRVWPRAELRHLLLSRFLRVRIRHVKLPDPLSSPSSKPERCLPSRIVGVRSQYSFSSQQGRRAWEGRALGIHLLLLLLLFHSFKHLLLRPQP